MSRCVWSFHACVHCQMVESGPAYVSQTGREQRSLWCWQRRPRRLNPHYRPLIIVLFLFFFLSDILMAAVACNYVAIICFLASNWYSIAVMQSQIVSITPPLAWQVHFLNCTVLRCQAIWRRIECLPHFSQSLNNPEPSSQSVHWFSSSAVRPTLRYRGIISLQSQREEIIDMYFSLSIFFPSSQVDSLKLGHVWNHLIFISLSSLLIF